MRPARLLATLLLFLLALAGAGSSARAQTPAPIAAFRVDSLGLAHVTVASDPASYHVLWATNVGDAEAHPVDLALGQAGSATLLDRLPALARDAYRVTTYARSNPGDVDGDGRDDLAEIARADNRAPFNFAAPVAAEAGQLVIADTAAFADLSIQAGGAFSYLAGSVFTKVYITDNASRDSLGVYFMDVGRYVRHKDFAAAVGIAVEPSGLDLPDDSRGTVVYHPDVVAPNGVRGLYTFQFRSFDEYDFALIQRIHDAIAANLPLLRGNLAYRPFAERAFDGYARERDRYDASRIHVVSEEELLGDLAYASFNPAVGYGILRRDDPDVVPGPLDILVLDNLPNTLQRVGGIISSSLQTPLSHVNLRAIQDGVPNCYVRDATTDARITPLYDRFVRYEVSADTFSLRPATRAEAEDHFDALRPDSVRRFAADFGVRDIAPLDALGFADAAAYGAKAANVAELGTLGFAPGTVPEGYAVPFRFYREFMERNGLFARARAMLADEAFGESFAVQRERLRELRAAIRAGTFSREDYAALTRLQERFPATTPIRCRSSTNGEDLPGFSGAGLYDSKTQHPDEGHIEKSIKQVFASTWNYRAFLERDFYRADHFSAMMGVLVHPSYKRERVNGVGVTRDPVYGRSDRYYINAQVSDNLVTNPEGDALPEELVLDIVRRRGLGFEVTRRSNLVPFGERVLDTVYLNALRPALGTIHEHFGRLYGALDDPAFAMEIEFKVDSAGRLAIKQARPWAGYVPQLVHAPPTAADVAVPYRLYPNPVTAPARLTVEAAEACALTLEVFTLLGQAVWRRSYPVAQGKTSLGLAGLYEELPPGAYVYRVVQCGEELGGGTLLR